MTNVLTSTAFGEAYIAVNKSRRKTYNNNVYLQNGQEFQIELFNPTTNTKLAKISINGQLISTAGLVLKPGQRVYLERYIDEAKKFLFETYNVENTATVRAAIVNNGFIEVSFYDEFVPAPKPYENIPWTYTTGTINTSYYNNVQNTTSNLSSSLKRSSLTSGGDSQSFVNSSLETGRVEKGDYSNQKFKSYDGNFNNYTTNVVHIKILPVSEKPLEIKDLATYCTNCGTRNKKGNYKYCPKCGRKF